MCIPQTALTYTSMNQVFRNTSSDVFESDEWYSANTYCQKKKKKGRTLCVPYTRQKKKLLAFSFANFETTRGTSGGS